MVFMVHEGDLKGRFLTFVYFVLAFPVFFFFVLTWKTTGITSWSLIVSFGFG